MGKIPIGTTKCTKYTHTHTTQRLPPFKDDFTMHLKGKKPSNINKVEFFAKANTKSLLISLNTKKVYDMVSTQNT